ncbi:hypothetical protein BJ138DRAFT_1016769, partial [Hygrophoropsis aurantiaca]
FDTVVVTNTEDAESTGLQGETSTFKTINQGMRIGRLRAIFKLPQRINGFPAPSTWPINALAHVEWYDKLGTTADPDSLMYSISKATLRADDTPPGEIIPLSAIRQSCQLIPAYGGANVQANWTSSNVLDKAQKFWINNWASKYSYQTLW